MTIETLFEKIRANINNPEAILNFLDIYETLHPESTLEPDALIDAETAFLRTNLEKITNHIQNYQKKLRDDPRTEIERLNDDVRERTRPFFEKNYLWKPGTELPQTIPCLCGGMLRLLKKRVQYYGGCSDPNCHRTRSIKPWPYKFYDSKKESEKEEGI